MDIETMKEALPRTYYQPGNNAVTLLEQGFLTPEVLQHCALEEVAHPADGDKDGWGSLVLRFPVKVKNGPGRKYRATEV